MLHCAHGNSLESDQGEPAMKQGIRSATRQSSPEAIQACVASLAAEAFDLGHIQAARILAQAAALLTHRELWAERPD